MSTALLATLSAVFADGSTPLRSRPAQQPLSLAQYAAGYILVECVNSDGSVHDLAYDTLLLGVRLHGTDADAAISLQATILDTDPSGAPASNWARFELVPGHWSSAPPKTYAYEVVALVGGNPDDRMPVVPSSPWKTTDADVHPGDNIQVPTAQQPLALGPVGPTGPQGLIGPAGPTGAQGPAGKFDLFTVATLPLASTLPGGGALLTDIKQSLISDGSQWYQPDGAQFDRFLGRIRARGVDYIWAAAANRTVDVRTDPDIGSAVAHTPLLFSGSGVGATSLYPASSARPFSLSGVFAFASTQGSVDVTGTQFSWLYSFRAHALGDNASGHNAFGFSAAMFTDVTSTGKLRFSLQGVDAILSAAGTIVVETDYLVHLVWDGAQFALLLSSAASGPTLIGVAAGSPSYGSNSITVNFGDGNMDMQTAAYGLRALDVPTIGDDRTAWLTAAG